MTAALNVLIASPVEAEHADRIASADSRINLLYEPDLLPVPRYPADHGGTARDLDEASLAKWSQLRAAAEVSFDFDWQAPAQIPQNSPRLRWIQGTSAGIGGMLDRTGLVKSPIVFTTAAGVHGVPLAEFTLLGLLHFAKRMPRLARDRAERRWQMHTTTQLRGSRVLLVGLGGVGREVARSLAAVGVEVVGAGLPGKTYDLQGVREYVTDSQIGDVLATVDALVLACPLTARTRHLIGEREIALMRPGAVIVNVARGAVIDESALIDALTAGHLGGACLDVFEIEPLPENHPLWSMPNVIITPHVAGTSPRIAERHTQVLLENVRRFVAGEPPATPVDKRRWY